MTTRVAYVLEGRVPSNNGYVIHAVRMCEALESTGFDPILYHSNRCQIQSELRGVDTFEYYGIDQKFTLTPLPFLDFKQFHGRINERLLRPWVLGSNLAFWVVAAAAVKRSDADLAITRDWPIAYLLVRFGVPTVFEIHKFTAPSFSERGQRAIAKIADKSALRQVVTLTTPARDKLVEIGIPKNKILVEPDGVDLERYETVPDCRSAREQIGIPHDEFVVVYTGSLQFPKGIPDLLRAFDDINGGRLLLVGGTDEEQERTKMFVKKHEIRGVDLVGRVSPQEVPIYQRAADVVALPATDEAATEKHHPESTSPLKMFEYMAADRPIVATELPGICDVLTHEENALVVPPGSPDDFAAGIRRLRADSTLSERLANQARADVRGYTWRNRSQRIVAAATEC